MSEILSKKIVMSSHVLSKRVGDEMVLLELKSENYYGLDSVGRRIWEIMQERQDVRSVVDVLINEYDVDEKTLCADLEELIQDLINSGLIALK